MRTLLEIETEIEVAKDKISAVEKDRKDGTKYQDKTYEEFFDIIRDMSIKILHPLFTEYQKLENKLTYTDFNGEDIKIDELNKNQEA